MHGLRAQHENTMTPGKIEWIDLMVGEAQADAVRDFYQVVAG